MRYGVIVAALMACGPARASDLDCGSNPNATVGFECTMKKFGGFPRVFPSKKFGEFPGVFPSSPEQPQAHSQEVPSHEKFAFVEAFPEPIIVGIGGGAFRSIMLGINVIAVGRCAGASLVEGSDVILLGDYTAAPGPKTSHYINWRNETCLHYGVVVKCPPPEPECGK